MHICYVAIDYHENDGGGGIASYVNAVGKELSRQGHKVTILANGKERRATIADGINLIRMPFGNLHWYSYKLGLPGGLVLPLREIEWSLNLRRSLARLMREEKFDVIEACEAALFFLKRGAVKTIPLVVRLHGEQYVFAKYSGQAITPGESLLHRMELRSLRYADALTAPSSFQAQEMTNELGSNSIKVIPNPIDPWMLEQGQSSQSPNTENGRDTVLYTGRLQYAKGVLVLLDAVPMVAREHKHAHFTIAGARHTSIDDAALTQRLNADDTTRHVSLPGHVPWRKLVEHYRAAKIFVMPSYYETGGISVIEAMAFGLPVVATRAGGLSEVVEDGVTGILVPPGDSTALAEAICRLLRDPELRRSMGAAGRSTVLEKFTVDRLAARTLAVYQSLASN
jgi:glycosyltransferase involved in cell wall biosynthesis